MKISQSLIKEVQKSDHCPKQIYFSFVKGIEIEDVPEGWIIGRYFESELLGSCRGGNKQEAKYKQINLKPLKSENKPVKIKFLQSRGIDTEGLTVKELDEKIQFEPSQYINGDKLQPYLDCDELVVFAKEVFNKIGLDISKGESQLDVESELLKGAIDHRNKDIEDSSKLANYDLKWTATSENDRWNGWGNPEDKFDAITQAAQYTLISFEETGEWMPFYFLVFGKAKWVKIIRYQFTNDSINQHKSKIAYTSEMIREYALNNYKGNGSFNKCNSCSFNQDCEDRSKKPEVEIYQV